MQKQQGLHCLIKKKFVFDNSHELKKNTDGKLSVPHTFYQHITANLSLSLKRFFSIEREM